MKIRCEKCGREITSQGFKNHLKVCNGSGILKRERTSLRKGLDWSKGKTFSELYGNERAREIGEKISKSLLGHSTGKCTDPIKEIERKKKIAISMKGNKNGATCFRRRKILYKDIHFKSKWEANVAKYLDENDILWKYENVTYTLSDTTSYTPDFSIYENDKFKTHIEVKGYFRKDNKEKFDTFLKKYPNVSIEIWNKQVLLHKKIKI